MKSLFRYRSAPSDCSYLPDAEASLEYDRVGQLDATEYAGMLLAGWRRFGGSLFRPRCAACSACQSLRVDVARFRPDRSQRRAWKAASAEVDLEIGEPGVDAERLSLYDRYHRHQSGAKGWPRHQPGDRLGYLDAFVANPFPTEEWRYRRRGELIGVGYVDPLEVGLSAIYFYHDPDFRDLSLGTFNVLELVAESARRGLPHVYLGYYVSGCPSLAYKARFRPNEVLGPDGQWREFLD
jgi:arginine-tRNA-protein transferase